MTQIDLVPLRSALLEDAADVGDPQLRTLDAIHLASAMAIREELTAFVAYDNCLIAAAEAIGIDATRPSPGPPARRKR